jgi:hypothetical protein
MYLVYVFTVPLTMAVYVFKIDQVSADGAYDAKDCHKLLNRKGCKPTIPLRKNARWSP